MDGGPRATAADPHRIRRYFLGGVAVGILAMSATGIAAVTLIESPRQIAAQSAAPPPSVIAAVARWQVLRNAIVIQGTVRSARTISVMASAPYRRVIITAMPVRDGDRVRPGRVLAEVDGRPILLLRGRLPAYRDLHEGDAGPDVTQLQEALESLGYADYDPPGEFGQSTALALLLFYRDLGYHAPMYRPPERVPGPGGGGSPGRPARVPGPVPGAYLPMSEVTFIPAGSALVVAVGARTGSAAGTAPVLRLATGYPRVTGILSAHDAGLVRAGTPARVVSADPSLTAAGVVTRVGSRPADGPPGSPAAGYPVQVTTRRPLPQRLIGAEVRLTLWAAMTAGPTLTVPLAAVFDAAKGRSVYVVKLAAGRRIRVAIATGPTADGLVAVESARPGALRPGDRVLIGTGR